MIGSASRRKTVVSHWNDRRSARRLVCESLESRVLLHGGAPALPFTDGLVMRLSGDDGLVTSGTSVLSWTDETGNGNNVAPINGNPTVVHQPLNGHDVVSFDGVDDDLGTGVFSLPAGGADRTIYVLANYESSGWGGFLYGSTGANQAFGPAASPNDTLGVFGSGAANDFESDALAVSSGWVTQAVVLSNGELQQYANGSFLDQQTHTFNTGTGTLRIGASIDGTGFVDMDIAEILVFDRALSDTERGQLDSYFQTTYALSPQLFRNELVAGSLNFPMAAEFLPDGRILVVEKRGGVKIIDPQSVPATPTSYMTIPNVEFSPGELGVQDIVLDPNFATNNFFYVYYSQDGTGAAGPRFRISRFTHLGNSGDPNSEFVVYQKPETWATEDHHGGGLAFANDGTLLLTTGDERVPSQSQDLNQAEGKVIRVNTDGTIPSDNPFVGVAGLDEIYSYGLRNPFRNFYDPPTDRLLIAEVGGNVQATATEDIHVTVVGTPATGGENFGWPNCEGICGNPLYVDPIFSYDHAGSGAAVISGPVYHGSQFPSNFDGSYFYGDHVRGWIHYLTFDAGLNVTDDVPFADNLEFFVNIEEGPDGSLYYLHIGSPPSPNGELRRFIVHNGQQLPTITQASASPTSGATAPLQVNFSGAATGTGTLQYHWVFGDGNEAFVPSPTHSYTAKGPYTAQLSVTDNVGTVVSDPISITVGVPPTATINAPINGSLFIANDIITFSGTGDDFEDGMLPGTSLRWDAEFLHDTHTHPALMDFIGSTGSFTIPDEGHGYEGDTGYRIFLTVTDSDGLTDSHLRGGLSEQGRFGI